MKALYLLLSFIMISDTLVSQCLDDDWHNTSIQNSWLSCTSSFNPVSQLGNSHWIQFEFDEVKAIEGLKIWNMNHPNLLTAGIRTLRIDASMDGIQWMAVDTLDLEEGRSDKSYTGQAIDDFNSFEARHVVFTALSTFGNACAGLTEVRFNLGKVSTSTGHEYLATKVSIAPNPTDQFISIIFSDTELSVRSIEIFDVLGQQLIHQQIEQTSVDGILRLDSSSLPDGHYTLRLTTEEGLISKKIVVAHP